MLATPSWYYPTLASFTFEAQLAKSDHGFPHYNISTLALISFLS